MTGTRPPARHVLLLIAGFTAWGAAFVVVYGIQATGCRLGWQHSAIMDGMVLQRAVLIAAFLACVTGTAALTWWLFARWRQTEDRHGPAHFLEGVSFLASLAAFGATVFCFVGVFWLTAC
jgi:hypothetical protein